MTKNDTLDLTVYWLYYINNPLSHQESAGEFHGPGRHFSFVRPSDGSSGTVKETPQQQSEFGRVLQQVRRCQGGELNLTRDRLKSEIKTIKLNKNNTPQDLT